ncbi:MAG TPA: S9 family peptidase [Mycobacteriales bacterium]|nr:S9 family peptidase [Mycobacteriales bacterium]
MDLAAFVALPRLSGLVVSPDGARLVTSVSRPGPDGTKYASALWEIDPAGVRRPRRLTQSALGESQPVFAPDGSLVFTSRRPDPAERSTAGDGAGDRADKPALWVLPAGGGEARAVASRPGGIGTVAVAQVAGDVAFLAGVLPGSGTVEEDEQARKARKDAGVTAILHERYPVRHWDHDIGPDQARVFLAGPLPSDEERYAEARDLTPDPQGRVGDAELALSPDGSLVAYGWTVDGQGAEERHTIVVAETATGARRLVLQEPDAGFVTPVFSPDGGSLACVREEITTYEGVGRCTLWLVDLATSAGRDATPSFPDAPCSPVFAPEGDAVYLIADERGHSPVFRLDIADGSITRLTASGAYTDVTPAPDGSAVYALRSAVDSPPTPVRLDPRVADQDAVPLPSPGDLGTLPGTLVEVTTSADDGVPLRAWLCLPDGASAADPAPLLLWIHGGPLASWNAWSWRWNPWLMVARGYAVLLPDPALSTGYGPAFIARGWGAWGARPYTDVMALTDAAVARDDIDESRTAAMGGSFGGYLANWVATRTERFKAIVTHASLWHLDAFGGATDHSWYWLREMGDPLSQPERYLANSPHLGVRNIRTPMLVIHGDKDYRVPIAEGLRLWFDLCRFEVPAKFLYFPDENHWILTPGHAKVWYETVLAFLAEHVLDHKWERPSLL